jgi:NADPH:quinone reductase-like Zn-dependent oxidoreductase
VQIAKALGAGHVTAVCSTGDVETAHAHGADDVVDYTQEDFAARGRRYDLMLYIAGRRSYSACKRVLEPGGRLVLVGASRSRVLGPLGTVAKLKLASLGRTPKPIFFLAQLNPEDLLVLNEMLEAERVTPFVDRTYPIDRIAEAMRYLGEGHARGKIVVTV